VNPLLIETKHFGKVEVAEADLISFVEGIPGFPNLHRYVLLGDNDENNPFLWLQAVDMPETSFVVIQPKLFLPNYQPRLNNEILEILEIEDLNQVLHYSITVVPEDVLQIRTNLQAPIVINTRNNKAKQVILNQPEYKLRYYIFQELKGGTGDACANQKAK